MEQKSASLELGEYWINVAFEFWAAMSFPALYLARRL